ncbi:Fer-1-like protein 6 [Dissostichus eleginoides]|uniref:Fer-1-like protein 6 n=1 Tax=Dissostichus eleginoides TaxID=100907 RepID=A0AAD9CLF0_DISEL|nr:Fer-1-like protein 6 [Dissostichus eleginoides]
MATYHPHAGSDPEPVLCRQSCPSRQPNKQQGPTSGKMNGKEMTHELLNGWTEESHQRKASLVATTLAGQPGSHLIDCVWNRGGADESVELHHRRHVQLWISADNVPPTGMCRCPPVQPRRPGRTYPISCGLCPILAERHLRLLRTRRRFI